MTNIDRDRTAMAARLQAIFIAGDYGRHLDTSAPAWLHLAATHAAAGLSYRLGQVAIQALPTLLAAPARELDAECWAVATNAVRSVADGGGPQWVSVGEPLLAALVPSCKAALRAWVAERRANSTLIELVSS